MDPCDFLIIGSGIAGLSLALELAEHGRVHLVTKKDATDSNTNLAQGGIASVFGPGDSFELHEQDTLEAGAGLCRRDIVGMVVREGPDCIRQLLSLGVPFTREAGQLSLGLEGGHSRKRIVHCDDLTGRAVERRLVDAVLGHANVAVFQHHMAVNLITNRHTVGGSEEDVPAVHGAYILDTNDGTIDAYPARRTVLATGGAGKVYRYTSNPDIATGDGLAMAYRAGARVANLEFVQFHPTCLYHREVRSFLLSEALRGEGGVLVDASGERFMDRYDDRAELAPRDIVARAIDAEMKRSGAPCVYLDMTHLDGAFLERRFPHIYRYCLALDIDMRRDAIPVVPATHYFCGGVDVGASARTSVRNLFAVGEVSHTGLHGANRLASNSLLEALVFARRAHEGVLSGLESSGRPAEPLPWRGNGAAELDEAVILEHDWDEARRVMWDYVGIVRSDARLELARERMRALADTVHSLYWNRRLNQDLLELRNIILVGQLIIQSALTRKESRGLHYTESWPERDDEHFLRDTVLEIDRERDV